MVDSDTERQDRDREHARRIENEQHERDKCAAEKRTKKKRRDREQEQLDKKRSALAARREDCNLTSEEETPSGDPQDESEYRDWVRDLREQEGEGREEEQSWESSR